ncbi:MAG TPA: tRNA (uridine(54)-C5)-methyltransferase TrmA, partial [Nannocystis exedens]|nr:tRNA (uridine(54)-C5)-methyltransferase TrmA [Nannocystis exedens]
MAIPQVQPARYQELLAEKRARLERTLAPLRPPKLEVHDSPTSHYRMRAEFRTWHQDDDLFYVMFERGDKHQRHRLTECAMVHAPIEELMFPLLGAIRADHDLRFRLFQI